MSAEPMRWGEDRYYTLNYYLKETFGRCLYKLALDGGMSCPNRDGTLGTRGCIFCGPDGSGEFAEPPAGVYRAPVGDTKPAYAEPDICRKEAGSGCQAAGPIALQIANAKERIAGKFTTDSGQASYIAYFQSYTNTYAPLPRLRELFLPAVRHPEVAVLSVATRPDCLSEEVCSLLEACARIKPVWVELGFQTAKESTARWIRRGYPNEVFQDAVRRLAERNLTPIAHLILGLPGETKEDMISSVRFLNRLPVAGVKFHLLHVLSDTDLAKELPRLHLPSREEYTDLLISCLEELSPKTAVHRITGDGSKERLLAPLWSLDKKSVLNHIRHELKRKDSWQGKHFLPE